MKTSRSPITTTGKTWATLAATALLLAACGGGGGDDNTADNGNGGGGSGGGTTPGTGSHVLTVQVQGLPEGAALPLVHAGGSASLTPASTSATISGNDYALQLGKLAAPQSQPYLVQCAFAEPLAGTLQSNGSLQVALTADATQVVQCRQKVFAVLQATAAGNVTTPVTGAELLTADTDGSQAQWLPARLQVHRLSTAPAQPALLGNEIYLSARDNDINSPSAFELRATDGTEAGTRLVKDIAPESLASSKPSSLTALGDKLYFSAAEGDTVSDHLWVSDGTEAGTQKVLLDGSSFVNPESLTVAGGKLFFRSGGKVYVIGSAGATPTDLGLTTYNSWDVFGQRLLLTDENQKQWLTDGTTAGARQLDFGPLTGASVIGELNGKLYLQARPDSTQPSPRRRQLYVSDGTAAGTQLLKTINPNGHAEITRLAGDTLFGGKLLFSALDGEHGLELWVSDGTADGTQLLKDAVASTSGNGNLNPQTPKVINGKLVFLSQEGGNTSGPFYVWVTDGTADGTQRLSAEGVEAFALKNFNAPYWLKIGPDRLLFTIHKGGADSIVGQVWITDGTPAGTRPLRDASGQQVEVYEPSTAAL